MLPASARTKTTALFLLGTLAAALYAGFGYQDPITADALDYHQLAVSLAQHNFFSIDGIHPAIERAPLYPFFLSILYRVFGPLPFAAIAAQCVLAGINAVLIAIIGRHFLPERAAWTSGFFCAVYPVLAAYATYLLSETLFTTLLLLGVFFYLKSQSETGTTPLLLSALCMGFACLTRPILLYFPLFWIVFESLRRRRLALPLFLWALMFFLTLLPWTCRNRLQFNRWVPVATGAGYALWAGSQPGVYPSTSVYAQLVAPEPFRSIAADDHGTRIAKQLYRQNLGKIISDLPRRTAHFWITSHSALFGLKKGLRHYWNERQWPPVLAMLLLFAIQAVLLILAARGAWLLRRHASVSIFFSLALYTTLVAVLTDYGPNRYHVPLIPLLLILGSRGITPHA